jgi:hypothetical protein
LSVKNLPATVAVELTPNGLCVVTVDEDLRHAVIFLDADNAAKLGQRLIDMASQVALPGPGHD